MEAKYVACKLNHLACLKGLPFFLTRPVSNGSDGRGSAGEKPSAAATSGTEAVDKSIMPLKAEVEFLRLMACAIGGGVAGSRKRGNL